MNSCHNKLVFYHLIHYYFVLPRCCFVVMVRKLLLVNGGEVHFAAKNASSPLFHSKDKVLWRFGQVGFVARSLLLFTRDLFASVGAKIRIHRCTAFLAYLHSVMWLLCQAAPKCLHCLIVLHFAKICRICTSIATKVNLKYLKWDSLGPVHGEVVTVGLCKFLWLDYSVKCCTTWFHLCQALTVLWSFAIFLVCGLFNTPFHTCMQRCQNYWHELVALSLWSIAG